MNLWLTLLLFALGIALTVKGGDLFVDAAGWIAEVSGIPKFIIGATVVSLATTLPELLVSVLAATQGKADMAVGNAVGSVTANTGLIMALALLFMPIVLSRKDAMKPALMLIGASVTLWLASLSGGFAMGGALILLVIFALYIADNIRSARSDSSDELRPQVTRHDILVNGAKFVLGAAAIVGGSQLLVNEGSALAVWLGVPERIIAVTLVAIGTSLPELVTTITAIVKKQAHLSVGNIIGANIIDLTLILPLCSLLRGGSLPVAAQAVAIDMPACVLIILVGLVPLLLRGKGSKVQGACMLGLYGAYLVWIL